MTYVFPADPDFAHTAAFEAMSVGPRAAAMGYRALAIGTDAIGIRCDCGLELNGRSAVGAAEVEARALYADHATRCDQALPLP